MTTSTPAARSRLSAAQVNFFHDQGYLLYRDPVFDHNTFQDLRDHFTGMLNNLPAHVRPENMDVPHFEDTSLFRWLFDDAVLDLVEPLLGPDIALFSSHFICKPAGDGKRVPWHEDSAYWGDWLVPMQVVTVWLALDPSDQTNGCLRVIPGTHLHGYSNYLPVSEPDQNLFGIEIIPTDHDPSRAVDLILDANQCSLHDCKLMHGSNKNTSQRQRCGFTMRYISTRSRLNPRSNDYHKIYLARGRDHAGNQYGDPGHVYSGMLEARTKAPAMSVSGKLGIKAGH